MLYSEHFKSPFGDSPVIDKRKEQNISLDEINREILYHLSTDTNSTDYRYEDVIKLRNRLNNYLDASNSYNHHRHIDNSSIPISNSNTTISTSTIKNDIQRVKSTVKNSNIGVFIDQDIDNSIIENEVNIENSYINNSNMGIEIRRSNSNTEIYEEIESTPIGKSNTIIIINNNGVDSNVIGKNINIGISIGN